MDMLDTLNDLLINPDFGSKHVALHTRERPHTSLAMTGMKSRDIKINEGTFIRYDHAQTQRYIVARDIAFDAFVSIYEVNTASCFAMRMSYSPQHQSISKALRMFGEIEKPVFEMRFIGLQDGDYDLVKSFLGVQKRFRAQVVEFDAFGGDTRHIAMDSKTGLTYNLLLLDRIYRPGELRTTASADKMEKLSKLSFV